VIQLKPKEFKMYVKPLPYAASELQLYIDSHIKAKIIYKEDGSVDWVNFHVAQRKVWSCDFKYFIKNFEREDTLSAV